MRSPNFNGLFDDHRSSRREASSLAVSLLTHGLVLGMACYGLIKDPRLLEPAIADRYSFRRLELHTREAVARNVASQPIEYPRPDTNAGSPALAHGGGSHTPLLPPASNAPSGDQTLLQPTLRSPLTLAHQAALPSLLVWAAELKPVKEILLPLRDKPAAVSVSPALSAPNKELRLADHASASSPAGSSHALMPPANTSPVTRNAPKLSQAVPVTTSRLPVSPAPSSVMSVSDLRMPDGTVSLPPANEVRTASAGPGPLERAKNGSALKDADSGIGTAREPKLMVLDARAANAGSAEHITLRRDGRFGVVVLGNSLSDQYPEIQEVWRDRLAYTAYLHIGLQKSWILQYAQLRSADERAQGGVARLEAPWPYDILRPNLISRDLNADALMVHGVLNQAGRLEGLAIAFPPLYPRASFVLQTLRQWAFRPALQNGKPTPVEVLLIIPEDSSEE